MYSINITSTQKLNQCLKRRIALVEYGKLIQRKISSSEQNLYCVLHELKTPNINYDVLKEITGYQPKTSQRILLKLERINLVRRVFDNQNKILFVKLYTPFNYK